MAFLKPQTLTCKSCGKAGEITSIVGVGPGSTKAEGPAYKTLKKAGPWREETEQKRPFWAGKLICPDCGDCVKQVPIRTRDRDSGDSQE